jgi:hypothetical protein
MLWVIVSYSLIGLDNAPRVDPTWRHALERIIDSSEANRTSFRYGVFRYDHIFAMSKTLEDAENDRFDKAYTAKCLYAYSGRQSRIENLYNLQDMIDTMDVVARTEKTKTVSYLFFSFRALCDGNVTLLDSMTVGEDKNYQHDYQIFTGDGKFYTNYDFPLDLGRKQSSFVHQSDEFRRILSGEHHLKEFVLHDFSLGSDLVKIAYLYDGATKGESVVWLDLSRGCVPIHLDYIDPKRGLILSKWNSDLIKIPNAGWIHKKSTSYLLEAKIATQIILTSIECDREPEKSVFQLEFPAPVAMIDTSKNVFYSKRKVWSLLDLPGPGSLQSKPIVIRKYVPPPPEHSGERSGDNTLLWFVFCAGLIVVIASTVGIVRLRNRRRM